MLYVLLAIIGLAALAFFLKWWHWVCEEGRKADESFRRYVDGKAAKEAEKETALEKYYKQHPKTKQ